MICEMNTTKLNLLEEVPIELFYEISEYLELKDIKNVRLLSQKLKERINRELVQNSRLVIDIDLSYNTNKSNENLIFATEFQRRTNFKYILLNEINFVKPQLKAYTTNLLQALATSAEDIDFTDCTIDSSLYSNLKRMQNLKNLELDLSNAYGLYALVQELGPNTTNLIATIQNHECPEFGIVSNVKAHIEDLIIYPMEFCGREIIRQFTKFFSIFERSLKSLHIDGKFGNDDDDDCLPLSWFSRLNLSLDRIHINISSTISMSNLLSFAENMKTVRKLYISWCSGSFNNENLNALLRNMPQLEFIKICYSDTTTTYGFVDLTKCDALKLVIIKSGYLNMATVNNIRFPKNSQQNLKILSVECILCLTTIKTIATDLQSLTHLKINIPLTMHVEYLPNLYLPLMFRNLGQLQHLIIFHDCRNIAVDVTKIGDSTGIENLQKLRSLTLWRLSSFPEISFDRLVKMPKLENVEYIVNPDGKVKLITKDAVLKLYEVVPNLRKLLLSEKATLLRQSDVMEIRSLYPGKYIKVLF